MSKQKLTISDIIETEYRETDRGSLILDESRQVEKIINYILDELIQKEVLKVSFNAKKQKEFKQELKEEYSFIELFENIQDELLVNICNNVGHNVINNEDIKSQSINPIWYLPKFKNENV